MKTQIGIALALLMAVGVIADEHLSVLFVGNSLTYVNDLPGTLASLAAANGRKIAVASAVQGGETLKGHAEREQTLQALRSKDWDAVVLQGQSAEPIFGRKGMIEGAERLARLCPGARKLAFITWAYGSEDVLAGKVKRMNLDPEQGKQIFPKMQEQLAEGYRLLAKAVEGEAVPVGIVWSRARKEYPEWNLLKPDGVHPASAGTYLAAIVFYQTLFDEAPVKMPADAPVGEETHKQMLDLLEGNF